MEDWLKKLTPVEIPQRKGEVLIFDKDEHPRSTSIEKLSSLPTPFRNSGTVTAGNASGVNDGAAAMIIASEEGVKRNHLTARARIISAASSGVEPAFMGIGPVPASLKALKIAGIAIKDIDIIEINGMNEFKGFNYKIPGDISSASFFIVLTLLSKKIVLLLKM